MTIEYINVLVELVWKVVAGIAAVASSVWAVNRWVLSTIYQTKIDSETTRIQMELAAIDRHKKIESDINENNTNAQKTRIAQDEKMQDLKHEQAIFKATYKGDMDLLKLQMSQQSRISEDILHKVNNISNWRIGAIVEHEIEKQNKNKQ